MPDQFFPWSTCNNKETKPNEAELLLTLCQISSFLGVHVTIQKQHQFFIVVQRLLNEILMIPGDPKPLVMSQSPQKVNIQITLHQRLQKRK